MRSTITILTLFAGITAFSQAKDEFIFEDCNENTVFTETLELDLEQAFVPAGFYFGWLLANNYQTDVVLEIADYTLDEFNSHESSGPELFMTDWDGILTGELMMSDVYRFSKSYYVPGEYEADLRELFALGVKSIYSIEDNWENFDKIKARLDQRYEEWLAERRSKR